MQKKKAISLIVLVITIIVMVILAGSIVMSLNNSGIIGKASNAVKAYNLSEVKNLAQVAWAEGYLANKRGVYLSEYVLGALANNNVDTSKYDIIVTNKGVIVENKLVINDTIATTGKSTANGGEWIFDASTGTINGITSPYLMEHYYEYPVYTEQIIGTYANPLYTNVTIESFDAATGTLTIPSTIDGVAVKKISLRTNREYSVDALEYIYNNLGIIKRVVVSNGIERIEDYGFAIEDNGDFGMPNTFILPATLKYIGTKAFDGISQRTLNLVIPASVEYIGNYAFAGCYTWEGTTEHVVKFAGTEAQASSFAQYWNYSIGWDDPGLYPTVYNYAG